MSYLDGHIARRYCESHIVCFMHFTPRVLAATLVGYSSGAVALNSKIRKNLTFQSAMIKDDRMQISED